MKLRPLSSRARRQVTARTLQADRQIEARYVRSLRGVMRAIHKQYMAVAEAHLDADVPKSFDIVGMRVAAAIPNTVGPLFDRMSHAVQKANAKSLKLLGIAPNDVRLSADIAHARETNIHLVEAAHRDYAQDVRDIFSDPDTFGQSTKTIQSRLLERGSVSESRAELLARDQTLKLNGQITQTRQENAGVTKYIWSTANDERVRDTHAVLEGQVFSWSDPPSVGHPGEDYQCRCVAIPYIEELDATPSGE